MNYYPLAVTLLVIFAIGIIANSIVILVLLRQRSKWNISTYYIFNICVADVLQLISVPFLADYQMEMKWIFGLGVCRFMHFFVYLNMFASIYFITALSVERWYAIHRATKVHQLGIKAWARWAPLGIWLIAIILSTPYLIYSELECSTDNYTWNATTEIDNNARCDINVIKINNSTNESNTNVWNCRLNFPGNNHGMVMEGILRFAHTILGFVIPISIICTCYIKIFFFVKRNLINKSAWKNKLGKIIIFIIVSFIICWMPYHVVNLYLTVLMWRDMRLHLKGFFLIDAFFFCLAWASCFINPIAYTFLTTNFQENTKETFCILTKRGKNIQKPERVQQTIVTAVQITLGV